MVNILHTSFYRKIGYINFELKSVRSQSVSPSRFLSCLVSSPKLKSVATQTLQVHMSHVVDDTGQRFVYPSQGQIMYFLVNAPPPLNRLT